jgi:plasmid stabilization system protein ParE
VRVEYSKRAIADHRQIAAYFAGSGAPTVGERVAARIQEVGARIAGWPFSGRSVARRLGVRVVPLLGYRYKVHRGRRARFSHHSNAPNLPNDRILAKRPL